MKKNHFKIFILCFLFSLLFLVVLLGVKQIRYNRWLSHEALEKGELLSERILEPERILWARRLELTRQTALFFQELLEKNVKPRRRAFLTSGSSQRYFSQDKRDQSSMGIFISSRDVGKNEVNKIIQGFALLESRLSSVRGQVFNTFFISKDNWLFVSPGKWIANIGDGHDLRNDIFYQAATPEKNPDKSFITTEIYYDDIWEHWMIGLLIPVYINDEFKGIAGHNVIVDDFIMHAQARKYLENGQLYLVNRDSEIILHRDLMTLYQNRDFEMNQKFAFENAVHDPVARAVLDRVQTGTDHALLVPAGGENQIAVIRQLPGLEWRLVWVQEQDQLIGNLNQGIREFILICFVVFVIFLLLFLIFFRTALVTPIKSIIKNLSNFQTGTEVIVQDRKTQFFLLNELFSNIENVFVRLSSNVKEIEESKEYVDTLMKTVQVFIIVMDKKLKPIYMNEYALKKLEINRDEISKLNIFHYIDKPFLKEIAQEFDKSDNILNKETFMILRNGKTIDVNISISKFFNTSNQLIGYISVVDDITKRKKAEMNLKNQIAFSRQIFRAIPDIILIVDTNLKIVFYNQKAEKIIEMASGEERNISAFLSTESLETGFDESLRNTINKGRFIKQINVLNPFKQGFNYVDLIIEPLKSTSEIIGGLIIMRDISEWRNLTERIKNLQEFMGRLIDASPYAVISVNKFDNIAIWNKEAEHLFNINSYRALDNNIFEVSPFFLSYKDVINEVKILRKSFFLSDQKMDFGNESTAVLNLNFYPVQSEDQHVVINIVDISKIRKLEDSLLQAQKMESLGVLTSGIIHDFNNILSGIIGYASLLNKKLTSDSEVNKYTSNIIDYSERASGMIGQILGFSKKRLSKKEVLDINEVIEGLLNFLKVNLKNIEITREFSPEKVRLVADKTKFSQVIINLIINAKEALEENPKPEIIVRTDEVEIKDRENLLDGVYAKIVISDNGQGIKKENLEKIFEPFFSTKDKQKSTGLGLATVKDIIMDFHGSIEVDSDLDKRTTFTILIPAVKEEVYDSPEEVKKKLETVMEGSVLLVDDEEVIREIGREMLDSLGIKCFTAREGQEALEIFKNNKGEISLVILDIEMPGLSGDQVAEKLKKINPEIKILFSSGYTRDYLESKVFKGKIQYFIPKPFHLNQLAEKLDKLIRA
ncbi:MAG: response regulator [Candidatus Aminicenantes bacterium]|nr:response regulator [Candidatus Aminicenantes bacterium]